MINYDKQRLQKNRQYMEDQNLENDKRKNAKRTSVTLTFQENWKWDDKAIIAKRTFKERKLFPLLTAENISIINQKFFKASGCFLD